MQTSTTNTGKRISIYIYIYKANWKMTYRLLPHRRIQHYRVLLTLEKSMTLALLGWALFRRQEVGLEGVYYQPSFSTDGEH